MYKYGLPYDGAAGTFFAEKHDHVDLMLAAVERHPEIHVVTSLKDGRILNRYESENADYYYLHLGDADPDLEFTKEWREDDFTKEEWDRFDKMCEDFRSTPWSAQEIAAVNWAIKNR